MVLAAGVGRLVAGEALAGVESLDDSERMQQLERPVDGRRADVSALAAQAIGDLARRQAAALAAQQLDDRQARRARPVPRVLQALPGGGQPVALETVSAHAPTVEARPRIVGGPGVREARPIDLGGTIAAPARFVT